MGTSNIISEELLVGSDRDGGTIDSTKIRLAVDFHCQRANRNYNKYVGVAKDRIKNGSLEHDQAGAGSGSMRWLATDALNPYSHGHTYIQAQNVGLSAPDPSAIIYVTWYVWFKGQRIDTVD